MRSAALPKSPPLPTCLVDCPSIFESDVTRFEGVLTLKGPVLNHQNALTPLSPNAAKWLGWQNWNKNWLTAASVWKGWRPDSIFHEFFANQNEVNFRGRREPRPSFGKAGGPIWYSVSFLQIQMKSILETEGHRGLLLERLEARFDFSWVFCRSK